MSFVTITDQLQSIQWRPCAASPDFFLAGSTVKKAEAATPMHLGVYGIASGDHAEIPAPSQRFYALLMYLPERKLFFAMNHVFSGWTGQP